MIIDYLLPVVIQLLLFHSERNMIHAATSSCKLSCLNEAHWIDRCYAGSTSHALFKPKKGERFAMSNVEEEMLASFGNSK